MSDELKDLKERLEKVEERLNRTTTDAVLTYNLEPIKRDLAALERRFDELLDATINGITTNSVEGLKQLKKH